MVVGESVYIKETRIAGNKEFFFFELLSFCFDILAPDLVNYPTFSNYFFNRTVLCFLPIRKF